MQPAPLKNSQGWSFRVVEGISFFSQHLRDENNKLVFIDPENSEDMDRLAEITEHYRRFGVEVCAPDEHGIVELRYYTEFALHAHVCIELTRKGSRIGVTHLPPSDEAGCCIGDVLQEVDADEDGDDSDE